MNEIQEQIALTDEVLEKLEALDPGVFVAGGAPRNWQYNRPARDVDVWLHVQKSGESFGTQVARALGVAPATVTQLLTEKEKDYTDDMNQRSPHINTVVEFDWKGVHFQVMQLVRPLLPGHLVSTFPVSISQAWYRRAAVMFERSLWFEVGKQTNTIFVKRSEGYGRVGDYIAKVIGYFPDHKVMYR